MNHTQLAFQTIQVALGIVKARCYLGVDTQVAASLLDDIDGLVNALRDDDVTLVRQVLRGLVFADEWFEGVLLFYLRESQALVEHGRVWLCRWSRTERGVEIWLLERPEIRAVGPSPDVAIGQIRRLISERLGDDRPEIEFASADPE